MTNLDYLYNPDAAKPLFDKNYFVDKKLSFQVIENGMILPYKDTSTPQRWTFGAGGIVDSNGNIVKNTFLHSGYNEIYTPPNNQFNTTLKLSFIWAYFILFGDMFSPTVSAACGF